MRFKSEKKDTNEVSECLPPIIEDNWFKKDKRKNSNWPQRERDSNKLYSDSFQGKQLKSL